MSVAGLTFLAPLTLLGLLGLPLIWWLLRVMPPAPKREVFPPLRLLLDVNTEEETPNSTPLWLLIFRLLLVTLIAIALARPLISRPDNTVSRPLTLIIDNGWDAAANWSTIIREAENRVKEARRQNVDVLLLTTVAPDAQATFSPAGNALEQIKSLAPMPLAPNHAATADILTQKSLGESEALWLSGGYDFGSAEALAESLKTAARAERLTLADNSLPVLAGAVEEIADGLRSTWHRPSTVTAPDTDITLLDRSGQVIARTALTFTVGAKRSEVTFELPTELRNRISSIRANGVSSAASIRLLDDSWGRPLIGLLDSGNDTGSPLLNEAFYTGTALRPYADIFSGDLERLLPLSPSILIMPDDGRTDDERLTSYVEDGGLLIRFAGPRLATRRDGLLPVTLRQGGRALGGALTWEDPQKLAAPSEDSPFFGLNIPDDVRVTRQVMAEPGAETDLRTWARLEDGSSIVTSAPFGLGRVVLFHVTAGPDWSNLAVSGLYVDMLRRLLPLARRPVESQTPTGGDWVPERVLNGFGRLVSAGPQLKPIPSDGFEIAAPSLDTPPGLYRQGTRRKALATVSDPSTITSITASNGLAVTPYGSSKQRSLEGLLLTIALGAFILDIVFALFVSGRLAKLLSRVNLRRDASTAALALAMFIAVPFETQAQNITRQTDPAFSEPALGLHLAYVKTGNTRIDHMSAQAMQGLVDALIQRTTIEPVGVKSVELGQDELVFYPFLYFPVTRNAPTLSPQASTALNAYMASGGTLVFDTQDQGDRALTSGTSHPGLLRITENLDMPDIMAIPKDHVLTKSFYLLQVFPGRWAGGTLWVDKNQSGASRDGVSSVIIGSNDWAAGWALGQNRRGLVRLENDIPRQREMSLRFGINLAMYALSGNYKGDQVHAAELIKRLGGNPAETLNPGDLIRLPANGGEQP